MAPVADVSFSASRFRLTSKSVAQNTPFHTLRGVAIESLEAVQFRCHRLNAPVRAPCKISYRVKSCPYTLQQPDTETVTPEAEECRPSEARELCDS